MNNVKQNIKEAPVQRLRPNGDTLRKCPFCLGNKKLDVTADERAWFCYKCWKGGALDSSGRIQSKLPWEHGFFDDPFPEMVPYLPIKKGSAQEGYLSKVRKFSKQEIADLRPCSGPSMLRVYVPLNDLDDPKPCYYVGRSMFEGFERYSNPRVYEFPKKKTEVLWGLHRLETPCKQVIVCEGIFSAVRMLNAVAILGKWISEAQIALLCRVVIEEVVVMLDGEAEVEAATACKRISQQFPGRVSRVQLPHGKDPDELVLAGWNTGDFIKKREVMA
mgnify:CR=1 FL=1